MMEFEGKDEVIQKMNANAGMMQQIRTLQESCIKLATIVDSVKGTNMTQNMVADFQGQQSQEASPVNLGGNNGVTAIQAIGQTSSNGSLASKARERAANAASPQ